jgi:cytochrome b subunit of formate dehydrogenase
MRPDNRRSILHNAVVATLALPALGMFLLLTTTAQALDNSDCFVCHSDQTMTKKDGDGKNISLFVDEAVFKTSVHGSLGCTDCHAGIKDLPHQENLPAVNCASCHEDVGKEYATSIHGVSRAMGASAAATCTDCHGTHNVLPVKSPDSPVFKLNLPRTCGKCHSNPGLTHEYRMKYPEAPEQYAESIHGRALLKMGLIVAPSCNDCHGVHNIRRAVDRSSPINHQNIAKTCGHCHVSVEKIYEGSIHGQLLAKGDPRAPVCSDCHTAHQIESPETGNFKKLMSDRRCGGCHQDRLAHYRETYHGKAMALGKPNVAPEVAACYDCHGHHDVLPPSDPASHLSPSNIVQTCRQCHPKATASFTKYIPHANPLDSKHYPALHLTFVVMTSLLVGTFGVFGVHTVFWFFRSGYLYRHDSKAFREAKISTQTGDEWFTRFLPFERMLHFMLVTSFLLLVMTGMPLKFYYAHWAKSIFNVLGGAAVARTLHHFAAFVLFVCFGLHVMELLSTIWTRRGGFRDPQTGKFQLKRALKTVFGPDSMMLTLQDWRDFIAHQKWFFGKGPRPQFDRWTYWEKFDYLAVFWGIFAIGLSGLIMWFPQVFTRFLPGWVINIALVVHSDEALLAAGFIFTFHFFNTHFRLEKFPMDTVIFSGRISKTEMLHERKRWYDRLVNEKHLEEYRVKDEWQRWKNIARSFGYVFFGLGLILLVLIVYAMVSRLHSHEAEAQGRSRPAVVQPAATEEQP